MKKIIFFSFLAHIVLFSLFSFTFAKIIPKPDYPPLFFWGQILPSHQKFWYGSLLKPDLQIYPNNTQNKKIPLSSGFIMTLTGDFPINKWFLQTVYNLKSTLPVSIVKEKSLLLPVSTLEFPIKKKDSVIMFHPLLPYQLQLYFKDRQTVHIELMFNIIPGKERNSILIKRKVSSGNLEADLLCARYIGHYLFIQQARFQPNNWQTVKIDLST